MSRSGGIPYHLKALRFKNSHWGSHEDGVRRFLDSWNPKSRHLLLIGPSGGYSLPRGWLDRFETVSAFDPDLLARVIIEKRLGRSVSWLGTRFEFAGSDPFKGIEGDLAVLFCNLLGQIEIKNPKKLTQALQTMLEGKEWASYHDVLSGPGIDFDLEGVLPRRAQLHEMKRWIYVRGPVKSEVEVNAHFAPDLFQFWPGLHFCYWQWKITPDYTHLIEGVYCKSSRVQEEGEES